MNSFKSLLDIFPSQVFLFNLLSVSVITVIIVLKQLPGVFIKLNKMLLEKPAKDNLNFVLFLSFNLFA